MGVSSAQGEKDSADPVIVSQVMGVHACFCHFRDIWWKFPETRLFLLLPLYIRTWQQEMQSLRVPPRSVTSFWLENQSLLGASVFQSECKEQKICFLTSSSLFLPPHHPYSMYVPSGPIFYLVPLKIKEKYVKLGQMLVINFTIP